MIVLAHLQLAKRAVRLALRLKIPGVEIDVYEVGRDPFSDANKPMALPPNLNQEMKLSSSDSLAL
jgi:hypothetical protein